MPLTADPDHAGPWFDTDDHGHVVFISAAAARLGIDEEMSLPRALALISLVAEGLSWHKVADGRWRCAPAVAGDAAGVRAQLVDARARLHDEVKRRRHLERQLLSATENEQRRISLELHDGLGQHLSGLAYTARSLATRLKSEAHEMGGEADWLARLLRDAVGRVRALSRGLWPVSLERQSLPQALAALAQDIEQLYGASVQVHADDFEAESAPAAHHLFRIAQEAIHNALKHGQARHIEVRLERVTPGAMLSIVSDGQPMDTATTRAGRGIGLVGMQLRADALGGELSVEPLATGGVEVCLVWTPTPKRRQDAAARAPQDA